MYERLPNQQLQGYDDDVVRDTAPPFRVLEKCQDLCLRDRTGTNNLVRTCTSFDFQPGSRITVFGGNMEYEESLCYLTSEQAGPEGIGSLMLVPNSVHFNEICLTCKKYRNIEKRHHSFLFYFISFQPIGQKENVLVAVTYSSVILERRSNCQYQTLRR